MTSGEVVFKLRHIPTGLFFQPKGSVNTSTDGKIYTRAPSRKGWISLSRETADKLGIECPYSSIGWKTELTDWEVVPFEIFEIKKVDK